MPDDLNPRAVPGGNNPPPYDADAHAELMATTDEFIEASQKWLEAEVDTESEAAALTDQISGLRALFKKAEDARKAAKQPHLDAGKAVDAAFKPITTRIETAAAMLKKKLAPYLERKEREAAAEKRRQEEEARKAREAAEAAARKAEESNNLAAQFEAEEAAKRAADAEKEAKRKAEVNVKSATGAGRTMGLRTVREVEITNLRVLMLHYSERPEVIEFFTRLAQADVRATDVDETKIPGIKIHEKKVAA